MADHYVAVVSVEAVTEKKEGDNRGTKEQPRKVSEVAKYVVRANSLEALKERLAKHVELIAE